MREAKRKGPKSRERRPEEPWSQVSDLQGLVQFINISDFEKVDAAKVSAELRLLAINAAEDDFTPRLGHERTLFALRAIAPYQHELIDKLAPLTVTIPPNPAYAGNVLRALTTELNRWSFQSVFVVKDIAHEKEWDAKWDALIPGHAAFRRRQRQSDLSVKTRMFFFAENSWMVTQGFIPRLEEENRPLAILYSIIAKALARGDLALLRRCPYCEKFFLAIKDRRTRFCPGHMRLYHDQAERAGMRVKLSRAGIPARHRP